MTARAAPAQRAIGVVRVSQVNGRDEADAFASPDVQRERIADLCKRENLTLTDTLEEMDVSGGRPLNRRTGLMAAIRAVEEGRADVIVVAYFDRLVRSLEVQTQVLQRVETAGGRVVAADIGEVSNGTAAKWLSATMLGMVAEYHNRITAEKAGGAQRRAAARGIPPMALPPGLAREVVGTDKNGKPILGAVIKTGDADAVRRAVEMRADGATIAEVREHLADHGIVRSYHGTQSLLASRLLCGRFVFGKNRSPDHQLSGDIPQIVDEVTWRKAQQVSTPRGRRPASDRILARLGVLRCATCGSRLVVGTQRQNGRSYPFYRCASVREDCPRRVTISAQIVEQIVINETRRHLDGAIGARSVAENVRHARAVLQRAQDALDTGIRTLADFADEPAAIQQLRQLRDARDEARQRVESLGDPDDTLLLLLDEDWDDLSVADQRRCIRAVFASVIVRPTERRGQDPRERVDLVYHDAVDRLTGRSPSLPTQLA